MQRREPRARAGWLRRGALLVALAAVGAGAQPAAATTYQEPYRPQFHFTPPQNWMNDPNGMVYYDGEYHLFYQHNPFANVWGHISWGHAVSRDLVHWQQLPVGIPEEGDEMIFSGSAVVDRDNTSGFGSAANPPMVAIYTSAHPGSQAQAVAYSTDHGRTWTKYAGNPVLDIGSREFRDPKVFWYAPERKWVMSVAMAVEHKVRFYSSPNLKQWTLMSDFGPANAVGGGWECPDLFPLAVDGDPSKVKWVLVVNLNPGGISGGSAGQYFVGDFDGTTFRADNIVGSYTPPPGDLYEGFEGPTFGQWTTTGDAFGTGPAQGNVPPQGGVGGYVGSGLANSFHGEDRGTGTLTSPTFTISRPFLNFLVGGGNHPHDPGTVDAPPPAGTVFADFEGDSYGTGWTATGTLAGTKPAAGTIGDQQTVSGYEGSQLVNTFLDHDTSTGHITSPAFTIGSDYVNFLVGGGHHAYPGDAGNPPTAVNLVVDGQVVRTATGANSEALNWTNWNVSALKGKTARIDIVDESTGGWGHINADQFTFSDLPAFPRSTETAVNLLVDGKVVRTATGAENETLDWRSWNLTELAGKTARIQIVDRNTGGWGHILVDDFSFAAAPAQSLLDRTSWLDYGKDFYAGMTWNDAPGGKRIMIGWVNNWQYADQVPTSTWRSAMSVPRETTLRTIDGQPRLILVPVGQLDGQHAGAPYHEGTQTVTGERELSTRGTLLDIRATWRPQAASKSGLKVLAGANGDETVVGYDATSGSVYVDRTRSGSAAAEIANFPGVQSAPVKLRDGKLDLRILVDNSIVEVYANGGERVITDQVYPAAGSDRLRLFAEGGAASLDSLDVHTMRSTWLETQVPGGVGGTVPATLSLSTGPSAGFGAFTPGLAKDYFASMPATVISTAGDATLSVQDPAAFATGRLVNGAYSLSTPLQANATNGTQPSAAFAPLSTSGLPLALLTYDGPVSNDQVTLGFKQAIGAGEGLRTGTYAKTLTFTLSTTTP